MEEQRLKAFRPFKIKPNNRKLLKSSKVRAYLKFVEDYIYEQIVSGEIVVFRRSTEVK